MDTNTWARALPALLGALVSSSCAAAEHASKNVDDAGGTMEVQFIRSATMAIRYEGAEHENIKLLVDPILADEGTEPPIDYSNGVKNPTLELPMPKERVLKGVNAVLLTHDHPDHLDLAAERILPKNVVIFCQPYDEKRLREKGFSNLQVVNDVVHWKGMAISRFPASHHEGATGAPPFGESSSYFLRTKNDALFLTGDAILDDRLKSSLTATQAKRIVANTGACQFTKENPVLAPGVTMTLTADELKKIARMLPASKVVAVHMDAINHCPLTKSELRTFVEEHMLKGHILVPNEGDVLP